MRVFRAILLPLKKDYVIQCSINPLKTCKKLLRLDIDKVNVNKLWCQTIVAFRKKETICLIFSYCGCIIEFKLNIELQMTFLAKKINLDMTDGMVTLAILYWVKNFKLCNNYHCLLVKYLGFLIKKILVVDCKLQLDKIWQHQSIDSFKQLITKNLDWFVKLVLAALFTCYKRLTAFCLFCWDNLLLFFWYLRESE